MIKALINAGANLNLKKLSDNIGQTKTTNMLERLHKAGVNWNVKNSSANTLLHIAASNSLVYIVYGLITNGAALDQINNEGYTALEIAVNNNKKINLSEADDASNSVIIKALLNANAGVGSLGVASKVDEDATVSRWLEFHSDQAAVKRWLANYVREDL